MRVLNEQDKVGGGWVIGHAVTAVLVGHRRLPKGPDGLVVGIRGSDEHPGPSKLGSCHYARAGRVAV